MSIYSTLICHRGHPLWISLALPQENVRLTCSEGCGFPGVYMELSPEENRVMEKLDQAVQAAKKGLV